MDHRLRVDGIGFNRFLLVVDALLQHPSSGVPRFILTSLKLPLTTVDYAEVQVKLEGISIIQFLASPKLQNQTG